MNAKKQVHRRRKFSESFKRSRVQEFERGKPTVQEISKLYDLHVQLIYNWIRKYSAYQQNGYQVIVEEKSLSKQNADQAKRIAELEAALGRKQMELEYLHKLIELSDDNERGDLKKKVAAVPWSGSGLTKPNTDGK